MRHAFSAMILASFALTCCGGEDFHAHRIALVSSDREVDSALRSARQNALGGDLDAAQTSLNVILQRFPNDPVVPLARVLLARVTLARGDMAHAEEIARAVTTSDDPSLTRSAQVVLGIAAVLEHQNARALELLRPLERQVPDRDETFELSCALAFAEAEAGDPSRALQAVALVATLSHDGVSGIPNSFGCDQPETRVQLVDRVLPRIHDSQQLATVIDSLPIESSVRRSVAIRLRALAEAEHNLAHWMPFLTDLPDDESTAPAVAGSRSPRLVVGILAPISGVRAVVGASVLRGVQFALEGVENVRTVPEDEGDTPADAVASFDRLVGEGARVVIGVAREDLSAAVAVRAQALGVDVWLLVPSRGVEGAGPHVHLAGPVVDDRATALATATRGHGARPLIITPPERTEVHDRLQQALVAAGMTPSHMTLDDIAPQVPSSAGLHVIAGTFGRESRSAMARASDRAPSGWVFEARSVQPGALGIWVGVRPGPAITALLTVYCVRDGEPPDELALLAHDAARSALSFARDEPLLPTALAPGFPLTSALISGPNGTPHDAPAAAVRCPR